MSSRRQTKIIQSLMAEVRRYLAGAILFNEKVAAGLGLNATDLQCLNLLELQGSATPGELARCAFVTTGGMTVVLDRLERAGYIHREPNSRDRRSLIIRPVPARLRALQRIYRSKGKALVRILSTYDERDLQALLRFFQESNRGAQRQASELSEDIRLSCSVIR